MARPRSASPHHPNGFGKTRRIRRRGEFLRVQSSGRRFQSRFFVFLLALPSTTDTPSRLGMVVSKKAGTAVVRNRLKRLCRECFRTFDGFLPNGVDVVVIPRRGAERLGIEEVRDDWARLAPLLHRHADRLLREARSGASR